MIFNKSLLVIPVIVVFGIPMHAQNLEEWTQQDKTKIKRLLEQIVANKFYIDQAKTGMRIISNGLGIISAIKEGDLTLHLNHFDSLFIINPAIKNSADVKEIISCVDRIVRLQKQLVLHLPEAKELTDRERNYCKQIFHSLVHDCLQSMDELERLIHHAGINSNSYCMTDDERIGRIHQLVQDMRVKHAFASAFVKDVNLLVMQRLAESIDITYSSILR